MCIHTQGAQWTTKLQECFTIQKNVLVHTLAGRSNYEYWNIELGLVTGYKSEDILPMVRYKAGGFFISPAYEKYNNEENFGVVLGWEIGK